ncbi:MAG: peptide ABC transporter substrate-binding protein [Clostridia bacterium]|nr:peptide ABC transporter substrate-binding protein [Clostridia bacterium]
MKKYLALLLVLLMAFTLLTACGGSSNSGSNEPASEEPAEEAEEPAEATEEPAEEAEEPAEATEEPAEAAGEKGFTYAMEYDITSLDPQNSGDSESITVNHMINEGLLRDKGGELVPGIAESWEVAEDGLTYTFHLRESVWSDGTPLTANDFVYSWNRMCDPNAPTYYIETCKHIVNGLEIAMGEAEPGTLGVEATDDYTLVVHMKERDNFFLNNIASGSAWLPISQAADEAAGGLGPYGSEADKLLTNGPFNVSEWSHEAYIVLTKNPNYWNADEVKLDRVKGIVGATGSAAVDMMLAGEIDLVKTNIKKESEELADAGFNVTPYTGGYRYLYFNGNPGEKTDAGKFMANSHFRRAMNYVINRVALCNIAELDCEPATRIIMPNEPGIDGKTIHEMYPYSPWTLEGDVEKAKEELQLAMNELGVSDPSEIPPLYLLCYDEEDSVLILQAFQDMLKQQLGVESTVNPQAIQTMRELWHTGYWDVFLMDWSYKAPNWGQRASNWYRPENDIDEHEDNGYENNDFDAKYEAFENAEDAEEAIKLLVEAEEIFCEDAASAIVCWTSYCCCSNPKITGILYSTDADFCFADITE